MPFRSDLDAAHARTQALEVKIRALKAENAQLRNPGDTPRKADNLHQWLVAGIALLLVAGPLSCVLLYQAEYYAGAQLIVTLAVASAVLLAIAREFVHVIPPGFALVLSGRSHETPDGTRVGFRVVTTGRVVRIPILERAEFLDCRHRTTDYKLTGVYSNDGVPHNVHAMVQFRLGSHEPLVTNAIERFLGRDVKDVETVAQANLEGNLRAVIVATTAEELLNDSKLIVQNILEECQAEMVALGLEIDGLTITTVKAASH